MDIVRVKIVFDFEFIKVIGDKDPYTSLLGIDWALENYDVIDLNKETMDFEFNGIRVTLSLYPY